MTDPNPTDPTQNPASPAADGASYGAEQAPGTPAAGSPVVNDLPPADDRLLRLAAEYDNYRKRTAKEKTEAFDRGATALATRLLDVLDDLERLAASDATATSYDSFRGAFELTQKKLRKELEAAGLTQLDPAGQAFDPVHHEAVAVAAPESAAQDHTVKATFQTGYQFKGTTIRPARVQVYSSTGVA